MTKSTFLVWFLFVFPALFLASHSQPNHVWFGCLLLRHTWSHSLCTTRSWYVCTLPPNSLLHTYLHPPHSLDLCLCQMLACLPSGLFLGRLPAPCLKRTSLCHCVSSLQGYPAFSHVWPEWSTHGKWSTGEAREVFLLSSALDNMSGRGSFSSMLFVSPRTGPQCFQLLFGTSAPGLF